MVCACKYRHITILYTYQMVRCLLDWITTKSLHRRRLWQRKITYLQSATKYCALDLRSRRYAVRQYTLMQILVYLLKLQHFLVLIITSIITTTCTYTHTNCTKIILLFDKIIKTQVFPIFVNRHKIHDVCTMQSLVNNAYH